MLFLENFSLMANKAYSNKVAIITGGSSGIGYALAARLASLGAKVVITGRDEGKLQAATATLAAQGAEVLALAGDVSQWQDCERWVGETLQKWGRIDLLFNNAGISMRALFEELDMKVIRQVMDINFYGTVYMTKLALPALIQSQGAIVGVSSIAGYRGLPARTGYSASKFAMQGFLEALRTELMPHRVHVLIACPGFTASNIRNAALAKDGSAQGESPREEATMMSSEAVADYILKALEKKKKTLVLTTQGRLTVWLNKWFSGWMDKIVFNALAKEKDSPLQKYM